MAKPAGWVMKSNPLWMPRARMFSSVFDSSSAPAASSTASATIW